MALGKKQTQDRRQALSGPRRAPSAEPAGGCPLPCCLDAASHVHVGEVAVEGKESCQTGQRYGWRRPGGADSERGRGGHRGAYSLQDQLVSGSRPALRLQKARVQIAKMTGYLLEVVQPHRRSSTLPVWRRRRLAAPDHVLPADLARRCSGFWVVSRSSLDCSHLVRWMAFVVRRTKRVILMFFLVA